MFYMVFCLQSKAQISDDTRVQYENIPHVLPGPVRLVSSNIDITCKL